jgi:hypothetical protein
MNCDARREKNNLDRHDVKLTDVSDGKIGTKIRHQIPLS